MTSATTASGSGAESLDAVYADWSTAAAAVLAKSARTDPDTLADTPENLLAVRTRDDVTVRPLYTRKDETAELGLPGAFPFVRGADAHRDVTIGWRVTERFGDRPGESATELNDRILAAAEVGTAGIWLATGEAVAVGSLETVLGGVYLDLLPVTLDSGADAIVLGREFLTVMQDAPKPPNPAPVTVGTLHSLGISSYTADFSGRATVTAEEASTFALTLPERVRAFRVDGTDFAQAGATDAQELGLLIAAATAHLRDLTAASATIEQALAQITFAVSVDDDQFLGIAKLRALRTLWARVAQVLGAPAAGAAITHAVTGLAMFSQRDPWVNMLRSTVAAFGAGVGGADQLTVLGYDAAIPVEQRTSSPNFSARIARNTQLLLLEESNIGRVLDPAGGSWYVESLTADLARTAWSVFTEVERLGGYAAALASGEVEAWIATALADREASVAHRRTSVTGVNEFPNLGETGPGADTATTTQVPTATPKLARVARPFEVLRDRADAAAATGHRPRVLLLPLGTVAEHNGRTTFAANLLAAGGIEAINPGPITIGEVANLVDEHQAHIGVLCGSKIRYTQDGPMMLAAAREAGLDTVLLAGPQTEWPDPGGVPDGELKLGIDAIALLTDLLNRLDPDQAGSAGTESNR